MKEKFSCMRGIAIAIIIPLVCLVPFITKAFHIDDTLFLWCAKQIQAHPLDFYGFTANWYGYKLPMFLINQNPPLVPYYISLVTLLFGYNEIIVHIAFLIPAVCLSIGIYFLARFFCPLPYMAVLISVLTPAFLVSGTNVMTDIPMVALYVWALVLWLYGMEKDRTLYLFYAAILISFSALTKYFGISLIPLLFVYSLLVKRKLGVWLLFLSIPIFILILYQWITQMLYNNNLVLNAASYSIEQGLTDKAHFIKKFSIGLSFVGGSMVGVFFYTYLLWSRRVLICGSIFLLLLIAIIPCMESANVTFLLLNVQNIRWYLVIQYALYIFVGMQILLLAAADLWKHRDAKSFLLFLWVFGTFFFSSFINWTVNVRTILPMVPAVGILVIRRLNKKIALWNFSKSLLYILPLIPAAVIALSVTWADTSLANCQRLAARIIHAEFSEYPHTIWFQGHWGFQYYMESFGAKALDFKSSVIKQGDIVIIPLNNTNLGLKPFREHVHLVEKKQLMPCSWLETMSTEAGAGFYSSIFGPLPFSFCRIKPEEYLIFLAGNFEKQAEAIKYYRNTKKLKKIEKLSNMGTR